MASTAMHAPLSTPMRPTWREWVTSGAIGCVLTCLLTYPTVRDFGSAGRFNTGDGRFSIWNVAWVAHAILDDPRHLFDANIFYPHPSTLTYSELNLLAGALAAPAYAATRNAVAAHNSAVLIALVAAFLAMWALVRRLTGSQGAAVISAAGYTFSAYTASHTAEIQLLMIFGFPLAMLAFHALHDRPTVLAGAGLGAALAVTALASGYYGVFTGGLVGVATIFWARRDSRYWIAIACAIAVTALLVAPVLIPYLRDRAASGPLRVTDVEGLRGWSAIPRDYVTTGTVFGEALLRQVARLKQAVLPRFALSAPVEALFPGVVVGLLASVALLRRRMARDQGRLVAGYTVIAALAMWASFGPRAGLYAVMAQILPGISMLRAPARLGIVVTFALAVVAGFGYVRLARGRAWATPVCLAALVIELWVPWPLEKMPPPERAYQLLASLPRGGVIEFPFHYQSGDFHEHTKAMVRSMANWQPLVNGYSDFVPPDFYELAQTVNGVNGFPDLRSFQLLRRHGVRYVLVRMGEYQTYRQAMLDRFPPYDQYLHRLTDDQDVWLFEIVGWPEGASTP